jgi:hypothetical protein
MNMCAEKGWKNLVSYFTDDYRIECERGISPRLPFLGEWNSIQTSFQQVLFYHFLECVVHPGHLNIALNKLCTFRWSAWGFRESKKNTGAQGRIWQKGKNLKSFLREHAFSLPTLHVNSYQVT